MVYGGKESGRHESAGLLNERQRLGGRNEAGSPRKQQGKVEQDAEEGVAVVADLKRLDAKGALTLFAGDDGHAFDNPPRQDFHAQQCHEKD